MSVLDWVFAALGLTCGFALGWMALSAKMAKAAGYSSSLKERFEAANGELEQTRQELTQSRERVVIAEAEKRNLEQRLKEQQEQLRHEFKSVATQIFDENSAKAKKIKQ